MKRKYLTFIFICILVLAIGYATIASTLFLFGNINVATNSFDVVFVKAALNGEDVSDQVILSDPTKIVYTIDNLLSPKEINTLEFYIKNKSSQYDAKASISCSAYSDDASLRENNSVLYNKYINLITDKEEYQINALQVEYGSISINLKEHYDGDGASITFRCTLIANAIERTETETKEGKVPGAYVMGMLAGSFENSNYQLLNNRTGDVISTDALDEIVEIVNSNKAVDSPVGNILTIMGNHAPDHYLICDGSEYNIADYPYLAAYFEQEFGAKNKFGGNGTTTFKVPDLRGEFLRGSGNNGHSNQGSGSNVGIHQDATQHPTIGAVQGTALYIGGNNSSVRNDILNPDFGRIDYDNAYPGMGYFQLLSKSSNLFSDAAISPNYTSRPTNTSVLYCIKFEPTYYMVLKK